MTTLHTRQERMQEIRDIVTEVLELEPDEVTETSLFAEDHNADSLLAIEILARLEQKYRIEIPQEELAQMVNLSAVYEVVRRYAGWPE